MRTGKEPKMNSFGELLPSLKDILYDKDVRVYLEETLKTVLGNILEEDPSVASKRILMHGKTYAQKEYERNVAKYLNTFDSRLERMLGDRSIRISEQIAGHVQGPAVLDIGCGDGVVGAILADKGYKTTLTDVYMHGAIDGLHLPFEKFEQGEPLPFEDAQYDTALLLTVMHHSDNPEQTLGEAVRVLKPGGKLIAIESVYGIKRDQEEDFPLTGVSRELTDAFKQLNNKQQREVNMFFDHFYNRILFYGSDVNVPYNFKIPNKWDSILAEKGLDVQPTVFLGIDQPAVPEYHTVHIGIKP